MPWKMFVLSLVVVIVGVCMGAWSAVVFSFAPYPVDMILLPLFIGITLCFFGYSRVGFVAALSVAIGLDQSFYQPFGIFTLSVICAIAALIIIWRWWIASRGILSFVGSHILAIVVFETIYTLAILAGAYLFPENVVRISFIRIWSMVWGAVIMNGGLAIGAWITGLVIFWAIDKYFFIRKFHYGRR